MPTTLYESAAASDMNKTSGVTAPTYSPKLTETADGAATQITVTAPGSLAAGWVVFMTEPGVPGSTGGSGAQAYTVKTNVTTANMNFPSGAAVRLRRYNSAGVLQAESANLTGSVPWGEGGVGTASGTVDLGTFAAGDRLGVALGVANSSSMPQSAAIEVGLANGNEEVIAPWTGTTVHSRSAAVAATGAVASVPQRVLQRAAAIGATATTAVAPQRALQRTAAVTAASGIASSGAAAAGATERSAAISAAGAVTAAGVGFTVFERSAAVAATGAITSAQRRDLQRQASIAATSGVDGAGISIVSASASLTGSSAVTATGQRALQRQVGIAAAGGVAASGFIVGGAATHERAAALTAATGITSAAQFWSVFERTTALTGVVAVLTTPQRDLQRAATLTATTGIVAPAFVRELLRSAGISATAVLTAAGGVPVERWPLEFDAQWNPTPEGSWGTTAQTRWPVTTDTHW